MTLNNELQQQRRQQQPQPGCQYHQGQSPMSQLPHLQEALQAAAAATTAEMEEGGGAPE